MAEYIEKAAILSKCEEMWNNADETTQTGVDTINAIDRITDFIEAMPAADVQPIKHGRWIWVKDYRDCEGDKFSQYKCSCCDFGVGGVYSVIDLTHFCGNCGARMVGDTNG